MIGKDGVKRPDSIHIDQVIKDHIQEFRENGKTIGENGLVIGTGGNMSIKVAGGILITSTGTKISNLKPEDIVFVMHADSDNVYFAGTKPPSSETITHWVIYQERHDIKAISHVNAGPKDSKNITVSKEEITYGTKELGIDTASLLKKTNVVMMRNHGIIAVGESLEEATKLVIESSDKRKPYIFT